VVKVLLWSHERSNAVNLKRILTKKPRCNKLNTRTPPTQHCATNCDQARDDELQENLDLTGEVRKCRLHALCTRRVVKYWVGSPCLQRYAPMLSGNCNAAALQCAPPSAFFSRLFACSLARSTPLPCLFLSSSWSHSLSVLLFPSKSYPPTTCGVAAVNRGRGDCISHLFCVCF
jgi:hypothetical protein